MIKFRDGDVIHVEFTVKKTIKDESRPIVFLDRKGLGGVITATYDQRDVSLAVVKHLPAVISPREGETWQAKLGPELVLVLKAYDGEVFYVPSGSRPTMCSADVFTSVYNFRG